MDFSKATTNGVQLPTDEKTKVSELLVIVSSTSTVYGRPITITAVSDAAMYKTEPVTFYSNGNVLGTAQFKDNVASLFLSTLSTGTHSIHGVWPGENKFAPVTTENAKVSTTVSAGEDIGGTMTIYSYPANGTVVTDEGSITFTCLIENTVVPMTGSILFWDGSTQLANVPIDNGTAALTLPTLTAGEHAIRATWEGGTINGIVYQGKSTSITYSVLRGKTISSTLTLTSDPLHGVFAEGSLKLTAKLNNETVYPGLVKFYNQQTNELLSTAILTENVATATITNNFTVSDFTFVAQYDGNQTSSPKYLEINSNTINWYNAAREKSEAVLSISPEQPFYSAPVELRVDFINSGTQALTGDVDFILDGMIIATVVASNNSATTTLTSLSTGTHRISALYYGKSTEPKYFSKTSNELVVNVLAGYPMDIGITASAPTYLDPTPGYYLNENVDLTITANTSTNVAGSTSTLWFDDVYPSGYFRILTTSGLTDTIPVSFSTSDIEIGTKLYIDSAYNQYAGTIIDKTVDTLVIDNPFNFPTIPVWFLGPRYHQLGDIQLVSNETETSAALTIKGNIVVRENWKGGLLSDGRFYRQESDVTDTIAVVDRPWPSMSLVANTSTGVYGEPITVTLRDDSQFKFFNFSGKDYVYYDNDGLTNRTFSSPSSDSIVRTYYSEDLQYFDAYIPAPGELPNINVPDRKYYFGTDKEINTLEVPFRKRYFDLNITSTKQGPYGPITVADLVSVNVIDKNNENLSQTTATFYDNSLSTGTAQFSGSTSTLSKRYVAGEHIFTATVAGYQMFPSGKYYCDTGTTATSISVVNRANYPGNIRLTGPAYVHQLKSPTYTFTNSFNTNTENTFYLRSYNSSGNSADVSTMQMTSNTTTFTLDTNSLVSGFNRIAGDWAGQDWTEGLYYPFNGTQTNNISVTYQLGSMTMATSTATNTENLPFILTATANTSSADVGTVSFYKDNVFVATTATVNNSASIVINRMSFSPGVHTFTAVWNNKTPTVNSDTLFQTILAYVPAVVRSTLSTSTYVLYNQDNSFNTATITASANVYGPYAGHAPTGTVTLSDGANTLGSGTLTASTGTSSSVAIIWNPGDKSETVGVKTLAFNYGSDSWNDAGTTSTSLSIIKPTPKFTLSVNSATLTQSHPMEISATKPSDYTMNGPIRFLLNGSLTSTTNFVGDVATISVAPAVGNYSISAVYDETAYHYSTASTTATSLNVLTYASPTLTLSPTSSTYILYNQDNTYNQATISSIARMVGPYTNHAPTGNIVFRNRETNSSSTFSLTSYATTSSANIVWNPNVLGVTTTGTATFEASYAGDTWNNTVVSQPYTLNLIKPTPSLTISSVSTANYYVGYDVTFIATKPSNTVLNNAVVFKNTTTNTIIGTANFVGDTASISIATTGTFTNHKFTVSYGEDTYHYSTSSTATSVSVAKEQSSMTLSSYSTQSYWIGYPITVTATRNNSRDYANPVVFNVGGTTSTVAWTGNTAQINVALTTTSVPITITIPSDNLFLGSSVSQTINYVKPTPTITSFEMVGIYHQVTETDSATILYEPATIYDISTSGNVVSVVIEPGSYVAFDSTRDFIGIGYQYKRTGAVRPVLEFIRETGVKSGNQRTWVSTNRRFPNTWEYSNNYSIYITQQQQSLYEDSLTPDSRFIDTFPESYVLNTVTNVYTYSRAGSLNLGPLTLPDGYTNPISSCPQLNEVVQGSSYGGRYLGELKAHITESDYHSEAVSDKIYRFYTVQRSYNDTSWNYYIGSGLTIGSRTPMFISRSYSGTNALITFSTGGGSYNDNMWSFRNINQGNGIFVIRNSANTIVATVTPAEHFGDRLGSGNPVIVPISGDGTYSVVYYPNANDYTDDTYAIKACGVIVYSNEGTDASSRPWMPS